MVVSSRFEPLTTGRKNRSDEYNSTCLSIYSEAVTFKAGTCCPVHEGRRGDQVKELFRTLSMINAIKVISLRNYFAATLKGYCNSFDNFDSCGVIET